MECPRAEMFQLLFGGQLTPEQQGPLADHAATCPACHAVVETMLTQQGGAQTAERPMTVGSVVGGRFRIDQLLGAGGMGIVVAATHLELGNRVAIKFMRDDKLEAVAPERRGREVQDDLRDRVAVERFIREARAVVKLRTEHVCRVFDVARLDTGAPYIVMELLQGVDLGRAIAARPLPATIAVEYVMQAMVALAEAHALGIVHRDLKPANLFVSRRNDGGPLVKVLDFGIAKALDESDSRLTRTRVMLGSPGYISPEQLDSPRDVDARTDIWALGVTLYQLLSGRMPFWGRNQTEIAVKIAAEPPPPLEADPRLVAVVLRCLEKSPDDRYPDVAALATELVPFGGPRARKIAAAVAKAAKPTTGGQPVIPTPGALPAVSLQAPTAATGATGATPVATTPGVQPAAAATPAMPIAATPARARRGSAGAAVAASPGAAAVTAASSGAMTVAVGRPVEISRLAAARLADARVPDAATLAAGSGASHPQRARRWQLVVAGVIGLVAAATITIAVRGLARHDDTVAAAPGSGVVGAPSPGSVGVPVAPTVAAPVPGSATPSVAAPSSAVPGSAPASPPSPPGAAPSAPHATAPSPSAPRAAAPSTAPRAVAPSRPAAAPSHPGATPAAPAKPAPHPAATLRGAGAPMPLSSLDAELKQSCDATLAPATAASVKPMTIVACWCQPRDQAHAQQAYGLLGNPHDRDAVKRACAKQGVALL